MRRRTVNAYQIGSIPIWPAKFRTFELLVSEKCILLIKSSLNNRTNKGVYIIMSKAKDVVNFRIRIKIALVEAFDNKCQLCGCTYPQSVYEFHHLNPAEKSFGLGCGSTTRAKSAYADEAKKCVMLCANCHRMVEHDDVDGSNLQCIFDEDKYYRTLEQLTVKHTEILKEKQQEIRIKPNKEQLMQDLIELKGNFTAVGRKYGYTANAVVKWCKKFNMPYHSGDYK